MDFDKLKVYGDTFISDGLVLFPQHYMYKQPDILPVQTPSQLYIPRALQRALKIYFRYKHEVSYIFPEPFNVH